MQLIKNIKSLFKRNYVQSHIINIKSPEPVYNDWTVSKAVKEGYKSNVWVYRAISLITKNIKNVPWVVKNDSNVLESHHLTRLFSYPNPKISTDDMWEIIHSWLQLSGNAYCIKVKVGGQTQELWPVSPDRMSPMQGTSVSEWIAAYVFDKNNKQTKKIYNPEEIIHFKFIDPSNPYVGIGPLQAAARIVDIDNDQSDWSKSTMSNRGVIDGVMTFEREFESLSDADAISKVINDRFAGTRNARKIAVLGGNAKYQRTALTPLESDFSTSRKDNRDEIFIAFGVPPQLGGSQESSTYNNYNSSILIFWFSTLIPLLDDIKAELNFVFNDELSDNESIDYDLSNIKAIIDSKLSQSETAKILFEMGVPFERLDKIFDFKVGEFENWGQSYIKIGDAVAEKAVLPASERQSSPFRLVEYRSMQDDLEKTSNKNYKIFNQLLQYQKSKIFEAVEKGEGLDAERIIDDTKKKWEEKITEIYVDTAIEYGLKIIDQQRSSAEIIREAVLRYLVSETVVLIELSAISLNTSTSVVEQVAEGIAQGWSVNQIQQALVDVGIFSESRALGLARTISGNAANLGQWTSAKIVGATHKTWLTSRFEVRESHQKMEGKRVKMDDFFYVGSNKDKARYPLDNNLPPAERMNCRCTLKYDMED